MYPKIRHIQYLVGQLDQIGSGHQGVAVAVMKSQTPEEGAADVVGDRDIVQPPHFRCRTESELANDVRLLSAGGVFRRDDGIGKFRFIDVWVVVRRDNVDVRVVERFLADSVERIAVHDQVIGIQLLDEPGDTGRPGGWAVELVTRHPVGGARRQAESAVHAVAQQRLGCASAWRVFESRGGSGKHGATGPRTSGRG